MTQEFRRPRARRTGLLALCLAAAAAWLPPRAAHSQSCEAVVYIDANFQGGAWHVRHDSFQVPPQWNDQISSIRIITGVWEFFWDWHYEGELLRLRPGNYPYVGDHWNDQISSFRCVQPTD